MSFPIYQGVKWKEKSEGEIKVWVSLHLTKIITLIVWKWKEFTLFVRSWNQDLKRRLLYWLTYTYEKLPQIVEFMLKDITDMFGNILTEEWKGALGMPQIDLNQEIITYLEHTLDDYHMIDVEYGGQLDECYMVSVVG